MNDMTREHDILSAARVVAAEMLADLVYEFNADGWGDYLPEISERAFLRVVEAMALVIPAKPTNAEYVAAYYVLESDAEETE